MKIYVIGNCQARPVAQILKVGAGVETLGSAILHLARPEDEARDVAAMGEADLILAQRTHATFKPGHLATPAILAEHHAKTLVWPNLFYAGQQPFLRYVTSTKHGRVNGPLEAYHDLRILRRWAKARGRALIEAFDEADIERTGHEASLNELRARESECAAGVSDLIEAHHRDRRLFLTFNHPTRWLMEQLCARLCAVAGLPFRALATPAPEPLGRIIAPSIWQSWPGQATPLRGPTVTFDAGPAIGLGAMRFYAADELEPLFNQTYDHLQDWLEPGLIRLTPDYRPPASPK